MSAERKGQESEFFTLGASTNSREESLAEMRSQNP